jgi:hypothetical protein
MIGIYKKTIFSDKTLVLFSRNTNIDKKDQISVLHCHICVSGLQLGDIFPLASVVLYFHYLFDLLINTTFYCIVFFRFASSDCPYATFKTCHIIVHGRTSVVIAIRYHFKQNISNGTMHSSWVYVLQCDHIVIMNKFIVKMVDSTMRKKVMKI